MHLSKICSPLFFFLFFPFSSSASPYSELFESWCLEHGKVYSSEAEKLTRFRVFEDNVAFVENHNDAANSTYSIALNAFADLTLNEFRAARLGLNLGLNLQLSDSAAAAGNGIRAVFRGSDAAVPDSIDWREKGAVTQIKDQGSCDKITSPVVRESSHDPYLATLNAPTTKCLLSKKIKDLVIKMDSLKGDFFKKFGKLKGSLVDIQYNVSDNCLIFFF